MSAQGVQEAAAAAAPTNMKKRSRPVSLPPQMVAKILARLPVNSLMRFRCLSNSSSALIDHPKFARMHLSRNQRHGLVFPSRSLFTLDPDMLCCVNEFVAVEDGSLKRILQSKGSNSITIRGSCDGLLSFRFGRSLVFYNPSTKGYKEIPDYKYKYYKCGLGYDVSVDDYKYVKIYDDDIQTIWVYSLREDSWTDVLNNFPFASLRMMGIPLNGALHWLVYDPNHVIAAYDFGEKKFNKLCLPDVMLEDGSRNHSFGVLGDCLCFSTKDKSHALQLWIMKEYGVKESWTKILSTEGYEYLDPLCYLNNKEQTILVKINFDGLLFWDPKEGKFSKIEVEAIDIGDFLPRLVTEMTWQMKKNCCHIGQSSQKS